MDVKRGGGKIVLFCITDTVSAGKAQGSSGVWADAPRATKAIVPIKIRILFIGYRFNTLIFDV
jgi:hypothetical protein